MAHNAYIYQAETYCEDCIRKTYRDLHARGIIPKNREDQSSYDSDFYPKGPFDDGGGEADSFNHCRICELFLGNPLTDDGIKYTIGYLQAFLDSQYNDPTALDQWAEELKCYLLNDEQEVVLDHYLTLREAEQEILSHKIEHSPE